MDKKAALITFGLALGVSVVAHGVAKQSGAVLGLTPAQVGLLAGAAAVVIPKLGPGWR